MAASPKGTLEIVAEQLVLAVRPLEDAVRDLESFEGFMRRLGFEVTSLPPAWASVGAIVDDAVNALQQMPDGPTPDQALAVVAHVHDLYTTIGSIADVPSGVDGTEFLGEITERLFELLLADYLNAAVPAVYAILRAVGVIAVEDHDATQTRPAYLATRVVWDAIPRTLTDPGSIPSQVYGWGGPDFDFPALASDALALLAAARAPAYLADVDADRADAYSPTVADGDPQSEWQVRLVLFEAPVGGQQAEIGIAALELPASATDPPGIVIEPVVPSQAATGSPLTSTVTLELRAGTDVSSTFGVLIRPGALDVRYPGQPGATLPDAGFGATIDYAPPTPRLLLGTPGGARLELAGFKGSLDIDEHGGTLEVVLGIEPNGLKAVIAAGEGDGFIQKILGSTEVDIPFPLALQWSSQKGISFSGSAGFDLLFDPHLELGPITIEEVELGLRGVLDAAAPAVETDVGVTIGGELGPIAFVVQGIGLTFKTTFAQGNAGPFDVAVGFKPPDGAGLEVDASVVKGGGYIAHKADEYDGILELAVQDVIQLKVIGILNTKMPDGSSGFSLLLIITGEFPPIQLGFGFTLNGVGGLARREPHDGRGRRCAPASRTRRSTRSCSRRIRWRTRRRSSATCARSSRPPRAATCSGRWSSSAGARRTLIIAALGVMLELPAPVRLVILGQIRSVLPDEDLAIVSCTST